MHGFITFYPISQSYSHFPSHMIYAVSVLSSADDARHDLTLHTRCLFSDFHISLHGTTVLCWWGRSLARCSVHMRVTRKQLRMIWPGSLVCIPSIGCRSSSTHQLSNILRTCGARPNDTVVWFRWLGWENVAYRPEINHCLPLLICLAEQPYPNIYP